MKFKKVVLAYSGGLDTSIIIPWIKENYGGAEIIGYCGDVGQGDDLEAVRRKAIATGASDCIVEDLREEFVRDYAFKALAAGAVYEDNYLLGTALARPLLAYGQVRAALRVGADALAHGATGKGNDQVRFEVTYGAFAPNLHVIAPWREWDIRSREDALAYAAKHGVPVDQSPRDLFSRDGNLWHLSHEGGNLEDTWSAPQKEMFKLTVDPEDAPDTPQVVTIAFEAGVPVSVDGKAL
jgi:argininosuccinate synthase